MNVRIGKFIVSAIGVALICGVVIAIVSAIGIFSGAIMLQFGFKYDSIWSIVKFFIIATIISFPISIIAEKIPQVLYQYFGKLTLFQARILYITLDTLATAIGLFIVDEFMDSIKAPLLGIFVASVVLAVLSVSTIEKKEELRG